jgi:DNA helicase-2/ATP-dependent DNA helicase PcrA
LRLLTGPRVNLGAADLHALGAFAADRVAEDRDAAPRAGLGGAVVESDVVDHRSIIDTLDDLPAPGHRSRDGRALTGAGHARLTELARALRELRGLTYLGLPGLVVAAERLLGLDIEVAVADAFVLPGTGDLRVRCGRAHLDGFRDVAASFAQTADFATLGAFLAWLDVAEREERGLDQPVREPDPDAVQVITGHGAKGLEWDVVAIPGLVDGVFPTTAAPRAGPRTESGWLAETGALPYPLRGDAADLPRFDWQAAGDTLELAQRRTEFREACGARGLAEERRLAYVAATRARRDLLLTAHWWGTSASPRVLSPFLVEVLDAGWVSRDGWAPEPEPAVTRPTQPVVTAVWPGGDTGAHAVLRAAASLVESAGVEPTVAVPMGAVRMGAVRMGAESAAAGSTDAEPAGAGPTGAESAGAGPTDAEPAAGMATTGGVDLAGLARLLLAERDGRPSSSVAMPAHLAASGLVRLAADRAAFTLQVRRPIPMEPTLAARRGTRFHEWVEHYFTSSALVDTDDLPGAGGGADPQLALLQARFLAGEWAARIPVAIEQDIETPIGGVMVRARIDAVFPDPWVVHAGVQAGSDPGGAVRAGDEAREPRPVIVVDWKTGAPPTDEASRAAREVQLAVYRLAWSRWAGLPLDQVGAAFHYVSTGETIRPTRLLTEAELDALVRADGLVPGARVPE